MLFGNDNANLLNVLNCCLHELYEYRISIARRCLYARVQRSEFRIIISIRLRLRMEYIPGRRPVEHYKLNFQRASYTTQEFKMRQIIRVYVFGPEKKNT